MDFRSLPVFTLAAMLVGCVSETYIICDVYGVVQERPYRDALVAKWRSTSQTVVLRSDGNFTAGRAWGCWDVTLGQGSDAHVFFVKRCVISGCNQIGFLEAEASARCAFKLTNQLSLRDCEFAGEYRRE
jgi:hypothetical protein